MKLMKKKVAKSEGNVINIKEAMEGPIQEHEFHVQEVSEADSEISSEPISIPVEPGEKVKVKFEKFVKLIATHNFQDVLKRNPEEEVILNTNLLADLANAHEERTESSKWPMIFSFGLILGVILTYILFRF